MAANPGLAIFCVILSSTMFNIGMVLEKKGAASLPAIESKSLKTNLKNYLTNGPWLLGFILTNVQVVIYWMALTYGPLSLVAPMMGFGLVVLVIFSRIYIKETISIPMYIGIGITIVGVIILGVFSQTTEVVYNWEQNLLILQLPNSIIYIIIVVILTFLLVLLCKLINFKAADLILGIASGAITSIGHIFSKSMMAGFDMADLSQSLQFVFSQWQFYLFFILLLIVNTSSLIMQQYGFQKGKGIILTTVFFVCIIIFPLLSGIILYSEWNAYSSTIIRWKILSISMILLGVVILSYFNIKTKNEVKKS